MRRFLTAFVTAAVVAIIPAMAMCGNQEVAEQIANRLKKSGKMVHYKIGVKYQDGTAWLQGRVESPEQKKMALRLVFQFSAVDRVVDELKIGTSDDAEPAQVAGNEENPADREAAPSGENPLRELDAVPATNPQRAKKTSLAERLGATMSQNSKEDAPQPLPIQQDDPAYADQVPSSFAPAPIEQVAAQEPQQLPEGLHNAPVARAVRQPARVAMMQRGPTVPNGAPLPMYSQAANPAGVAPARYDQPCMPNYAWPSYAAYPNYAAVTYPKQYSPTAWPYIGPFYPYPQVPMGWRKVTLEWDSGWWFLDFKDQPASCWHR
jgi:hypothetical protein